MKLNANSYNKFAVQTAPDGRLLGGCIFLPAEILEPFVDAGAEEIAFELIRMPAGILVEIGGGERA